jgi:catalase
VSDRKTMTSAAGCPVHDSQSSIAADPRGQVLMRDDRLTQRMAHFNRERVVHAKGAVAYGKFTVTGDLSKKKRAALVAR